MEEEGVPPWFVGAWKREWIERRGAPPGETRIVRDVQTPSLFGSVRIPLDRPACSGATSLEDLSDDELAALAEQDGFAGYTTRVGDVVTWHHDIDYQPPGADDAGRLVEADATTVYEHALDDAYVERWGSLGRGEGRLLALRVLGPDRRVRQLLSVVGDHFVYARRRPEDLPPAPSLSALVARADRATRLRLLDCELSYGLVRGAALPWEIRHSTLPHVEGSSLAFASQLGVEGGSLVVRDGIVDRCFSTLSVADLSALFGSH